MQDAPLGEVPTNFPFSVQPKRADSADGNRHLCVVGLCVLDAGADHVEAHRAVKTFPSVNGRAGVDVEGHSTTFSRFRFIKVSVRSVTLGLVLDCDDEALT